MRKERQAYINLFKEHTDFAAEIEKSCYNTTVKEHKITETNKWSNKTFVHDYSSKCYRILLLFQYDEFKEQLENNPDIINNIAELSTDELIPSLHELEKKEINIRSNIKVNKKFSRRYKCAKCGCEETSIELYQSRASDEANTISIKCNDCGHIWRHY